MSVASWDSHRRSLSGELTGRLWSLSVDAEEGDGRQFRAGGASAVLGPARAVTIYRRYPNKAALVFEAVFGKTKANSDPDTGSLVSDLREAYSWAVDEFAAPEARAALPGLIADLTANPQLANLVRGMVIEPEYARDRRRHGARTAASRNSSRRQPHACHRRFRRHRARTSATARPTRRPRLQRTTRRLDRQRAS